MSCFIRLVAVLIVCLSSVCSGQEFRSLADLNMDSEPAIESEFTFQAERQARFNTALFEDFSVFAGIVGSKQPQDFGTNANFGGQLSFNGSLALPAEGFYLQMGSGLAATGNAVQVFELLGESKNRLQSFSSIGIFKRWRNGAALGVTYDYLFQDSFDTFHLGQWRIAGELEWTPRDVFGFSVNLESQADSGSFNTTNVFLEPITQGRIYYRRIWETHVQTTAWVGIADRHSEDNAVTGPAPRKRNVLVTGADLLVPLNDRLAIYGEANIVYPADTGAIDAFLGFQWFPRRDSFTARQRRGPLLPVASPTSFTVDLQQR